jgi:hypothetical protein
MTNIGGELKSVLTDAEKAGRTGIRAFMINQPFLSALIALLVGGGIGAWLMSVL